MSRFAFALLTCMLLIPAACKPVPGTDEERFQFEASFSDDFSVFRGRVWRPFVRQGGKEPVVRNGLLLLRTEDENFGVARSMVQLRQEGRYHRFEARLRLTSDVDESRGEVILGFQEGEENPEPVSARWRASYSEEDDRWTIQPLVLDEDLAELIAGPTATVLAGDWVDYEIELDLLRGTITWTLGGSLFWQSTRENMSLDPDGGPEIGNFIGGMVEVDSAFAAESEGNTELRFDQVRESHRSPKRIEVLFSIRDSEGEPVVIGRTRVGTELTAEVLEDGAPLDAAESPVFLRGAEDLELDLVLVLDYTESMRAAGGGTGIDTMKEAARQLIFDRASQHRVAVVEFHDNQAGDSFSTLVDFTTNRNVAWAAVRDYMPFHGFSTAWDAVDSGLDLFPETVNDSRVKVLAFLSDGFDTSSVTTPQAIIDKAVAREVTVFNVGVENVRGADEIELERISAETGGLYYRAEQISDLLDRFDEIDDELKAQYKAAYVTPQNGEFDLTLWAVVDGVRVLEPVVRTIDAASLDGDTREGLLQASEANNTAGEASFDFVADHLPRRVETIRFRFDPTGTPVGQSDIDVRLDPGGPLASWTLSQEAGDWWRATGPEVGLGDFGRLFNVEIGNAASDFDLPFTFDNSLYSNGVILFGGDVADLIGGNWESSVSIPAP